MKDTRKVLVVDDEKINRMILCEGFKNQYDTLEANNGQEAIELLKEQSDEIAVILLDIMMPVMDGIEVLRYLKNVALDTEIPVIIITSDDSVEMQKRMDEFKVADLITKPFIPRIICRRTNNVIHLYENKRNTLAAMRLELEQLKEENQKLKGRCKKYERLLKSIERELSEE